MTDAFGRNITYMRVSITDRCNLRCGYCMPEPLPALPHDDILRYEEILRVCAAATSLGIQRFRITGGEPLVRKGCMSFLKQLCSLPNVEAVSITTNGVLLEQYVPQLVEMGVASVNISLDTLDREAYARLTGTDALEAVLSAIHAAVAAGLQVKINCVPLAGVTENEIYGLATLAESQPIDVRFIELMPTAVNAGFTAYNVQQILAQLRLRYPDLHPTTDKRGWGPARYYKSEMLQGQVGFIEALSNHFCEDCNRIRLTSEGFLKLCLYHDDGVSLRSFLRSGCSDEALAQAMRSAIYNKPQRHFFGVESYGGIQQMSKIGG